LARILVIDDDSRYLESMSAYLRLKGHEATCYALPPDASELAVRFDLVLLDIGLGATDGLEILDEYARAGLSVAMVSGLADAAVAVRAVKAGAIDVLGKPVDLDRLEVALALAEAKAALARSDKAARDAWLAEHLYVGHSEAMRAVVEAAERAARTRLCVLLHGPSGSGKEPLARWVHLRSDRGTGPFVAVNCAAIPAELAESELFGHAKGAFTGADRARAGAFASADGGSLFLDEVGELPLCLQAKLLRAIELGEYRPVGTDDPRRSDARIVSATNRDLKAEVAAGAFREDLLYRLAQLPLAVPSLEERRADITGLAQHFASKAGVEALSESALGYLGKRSYPGNVRELRNVVERALAMAPDGRVDEELLRQLDSLAWSAASAATTPAIQGSSYDLDEPFPLKEAKRRMELAYIERQVELAGGSLARAAERLAMLPNNLSRRLGELRSTDY